MSWTWIIWGKLFITGWIYVYMTIKCFSAFNRYTPPTKSPVCDTWKKTSGSRFCSEQMEKELVDLQYIVVFVLWERGHVVWLRSRAGSSAEEVWSGPGSWAPDSHTPPPAAWHMLTHKHTVYDCVTSTAISTHRPTDPHTPPCVCADKQNWKQKLLLLLLV